MDILSDDEVLKGSGGKERADAQKKVQHLLDIAGDKSLNEHFNDAATGEIPNNAHNPGPHQGNKVEEEIEDSDDMLDLNKE